MKGERADFLGEGRRPLVAVVDDEAAFLASLGRILTALGCEARLFNHGRDFVDALAEFEPDVVLSDLNMPDYSGLRLLDAVERERPGLAVVVISGETSVDSAVEAMKAGAADFITKPLHDPFVLFKAVERVVRRRELEREKAELEREIGSVRRAASLVGQGKAMSHVAHQISQVAPSDLPVLIVGESGTGKEIVARAIHQGSRRAGKRFVALNCSALSETLLESELFGHAKGAFTGALAARRGLFESAHGGTLFLDELGEMPKSLQPKLLRALQEGEIKPLGSNETVKVDVRVISATNADLPRLMERGDFRLDLFYRVGVMKIELPPLRERLEDLPELIDHFFQKHLGTRKAKPVLTKPALSVLYAYPWPGNVRELENIAQKILLMNPQRLVDARDLPVECARPAASAGTPAANDDLPFHDAKERELEAFEKRYVLRALDRAGGVIAKAAEFAGMDRSNFRRLMLRRGIRIKPAPSFVGENARGRSV